MVTNAMGYTDSRSVTSGLFLSSSRERKDLFFQNSLLNIMPFGLDERTKERSKLWL